MESGSQMGPRSPAPEERQSLTQGVSHGFTAKEAISPGRGDRKWRGHLSPLRGLVDFVVTGPTAHAVG